MREYTFQQKWPELRPTIRSVRLALEEAIRLADEQDKDPRFMPCPIRWASNVRSRLAVTLPVSVRDDEFSLETGFNLSLTLHDKEIAIRVLKAQAGDLPSAKDSPGRRLFFNQMSPWQSHFDFEDPDAQSEQDANRYAPNFVLVWSADDGRLTSLVLAYPKPTPEVGIGQPQPEQEWFWVEQVLALTDEGSGNPSLPPVADLPDVERLDSEPKQDDEEDGGAITGSAGK